MTNDLANRTISTIEAALEDKKTTAISEIILIIQELAAKAFSISIAELSQLIGRDPTITEKVLSTANTLGFNPSGAPVSTITEAIHTVGFEKIRNLSISLLLVESADQALNNYEQREIASLSVCSGLMAQQLANHPKLTVDPDLVFVCSSLRNYGKLLMTSFLVDDYREAKKLAFKIGDDEAFRKTMGLTPLQLGQYLLKSTNLPKSIMLSLREVPPEKLAKAAESQNDEALLLSELSSKVCEIAFDDNVSPEQFEQSIAELADRFGRTLPINADRINQALIDVDRDLQFFNNSMGSKGSNTPASINIRARVSGNKIPKRLLSPKLDQRHPSKPLPEVNDDELANREDENFQKALKAIAEALEQDKNVDWREIYSIAIEATMESLQLASCMIFLKEEELSQSYSARVGSGILFNRIRNRPVVSSKNRDIFSICLNRKEDILIQDLTAGKIKSVIPEWIELNSKATSLIILPLIVNDSVYAIILGTVDGGSIVLKKDDHRRMKQLRSQLTKSGESDEYN